MNCWLTEIFKKGTIKFLMPRLLCQKVCLCTHYITTNSLTLTSKEYEWLSTNKNGKICFYDKTGMKKTSYRNS